MKIVFSETSSAHKSEIINIIKDFEVKGENIYGGSRNTIKTYDVGDIVINVKSFKIPNLINQIAYRFFRKSKAQRSFEYAEKLQSLNIGTPQPIAYFENSSFLFFKDSFYVSEHLQADITYRELTKDFNYPNHEEILRAFTRFTFKLHENKVLFLDHSPGNTLIKLNNGDYKFYLVDLNRMNFKNLSLDERIKNFARLTSSKKIVAIMSKEYARLINKPQEEIYQKMWQYTSEFQEKFYRKKRLKKSLKFWKS
ncbi:lipopolysaccharide kinase InaA family protein [Mesonia aquimarina]|uniref:lipopolysaccharide kinase InaA family protein n=1 Tax=Mesonia aquimarina TaxID=1504967 RepID=UPI000EF5C1C0|nr:lipopolysaccharide kinase InaA family protein [Mesonia aquimarina]